MKEGISPLHLSIDVSQCDVWISIIPLRWKWRWRMKDRGGDRETLVDIMKLLMLSPEPSLLLVFLLSETKIFFIEVSLSCSFLSAIKKIKKNCNYTWGQMLTRFIVVIISQYMQISHHCVVMKLIQWLYVNYTSIEKGRRYN